MNQAPPQRRSPNVAGAGLFSFLDPILQPGPAWMLDGVRQHADRGDDCDEPSAPRVVLEAFIPPDKTYRSPFPIDTLEMLAIVRQTPGARARWVVVGETAGEQSAREATKSRCASGAERADEKAPYSFPPRRYTIRTDPELMRPSIEDYDTGREDEPKAI